MSSADPIALPAVSFSSDTWAYTRGKELRFGLGHQYATLDPVTLKHLFKVSPSEHHLLLLDRCSLLQTSFATNVIYAFALIFVKISILCLYIRVLTYNFVRLAAKIILGIVVISHLWIIASLFTGCIPLEAMWKFSQASSAYCHPGSVYWSHSGINIATDFLIFLLPLTVLHKLRTPWKQKVGLYFVFLLAFWSVAAFLWCLPVVSTMYSAVLTLLFHFRSVCIISILRTLQFIRFLVLRPKEDPTWDLVIIGDWNMLEVNFAVICACLTTIKPVLTLLFPRWLSSSIRSDDLENAAARRAQQEHRSPFDSYATSTGKGLELASLESKAIGKDEDPGVAGHRKSVSGASKDSPAGV